MTNQLFKRNYYRSGSAYILVFKMLYLICSLRQ